jgi:nucleoside-triphosphatase
MTFERSKLILWTGEKHSGKTTGAARLVQAVRSQGYAVAGLVAPAVYRDGALVGFDAVDLRSGQRTTLARDNGSGGTAGRFEFLAEGLRLGNASLSPSATASADLIVVDEFGPLELKGQGWRRSVDALTESSEATMLLVVRSELVGEVERVYGHIESIRLCVDGPEAVRTAISILEGRREHARGHNATT